MSIEGLSEFAISQQPPEYPHRMEEPTVSLLDLEPGKYVNTIVRVAFIRPGEKEDQLGRRRYIFGLAEDRTFRTPFVCYKPDQAFFGDTVFKFENAYVHEFDDHSLLLILTEYSKVNILPEEPPEEYFWQPRIGHIRRPLGRVKVTLEGVISKVYDSSGLIRRCERCARPVYEETCPSCGESPWYWSMRISSKLSDETGSINTVFSQYLTCRLLGRSISEVLCMAKVPEQVCEDRFNVETFKIRPPPRLHIRESIVVDPFFFRQCEKLIVPDKRRSSIYCPLDVKVVSRQVLDTRERVLEYQNEEDKTLYARILEKALDLEIRRRTHLPKLHGIYLTEEPVPLFSAEGAKLYLGLELNVSTELESVNAEFCPVSLIRESVLDYVQWRRSRGASAESIRNTLLKWKKNVILAPNGTIGAISKVVFKSASDFYVPAFEVPLTQFWKVAHDIEVSPEEKPLLVVRPYSLDMDLTYPPSCAFFDEQSLYLKGSVQKFIDYKKSKLKSNIKSMAQDMIRSVKIDGWNIEVTDDTFRKIDAERTVFNDIKQKLLGKTVKATGSIVQQADRLYFFPKTIEGVR